MTSTNPGQATQSILTVAGETGLHDGLCHHVNSSKGPKVCSGHINELFLISRVRSIESRNFRLLVEVWLSARCGSHSRKPDGGVK